MPLSAPDGELTAVADDGADSPALSAFDPRLARLTETAKAYARAARSENTARAYDSDWRQFASWLRRNGFDEHPPDPETVGLYLAAQAEAGVSVATLERRLSGICWRYRQLGSPLDASDRHIATVLAGIRRKHARPPAQKAAIFADELLGHVGHAGDGSKGPARPRHPGARFRRRLRRSEIVGLDCGPGQSEDGSGWIEIYPAGEDPNNDGGVLLQISGKTGWREVEIGRGSRPDTCPVALLETWMRLGRIGHGPLFRPIARKNGGVSARAALRQACRPTRPEMRAGGGDSRRSHRRRTSPRFRRPFLARRPRLLCADRRGACAKAPRPRQPGNDAPLSAQTRSLQSQSDQGRGTVARCKIVVDDAGRTRSSGGTMIV